MTENPTRHSVIRSKIIAATTSGLPLHIVKPTTTADRPYQEKVDGMTILFLGESITNRKRGIIHIIIRIFQKIKSQNNSRIHTSSIWKFL